ncbi:MAG TPA: hypothetical protein VE955_09695, partial [Candidatus Dormibacteraeota bacterium]|nr:hypothetical protein [Candidatus Dormibacteraeota bacterium]
LILFVILPFIDRGENKRMRDRPVFIALGAVFVAELATLTYWGLVTPGEIISNEQAALVLGGVALAVVGGTFLLHNLLYHRARTAVLTKSPSANLRSAQAWTCVAFVVLVGVGALSIGGSLDAVVRIILGGISMYAVTSLLVSILSLAGVALGTIFLIYRLDMGTGLIKRRVRLLEIGWEKNEAV